jgi:cytochrome c-type protein NapB
MAVADVGFAPPAPHLATRGMEAGARCEQCHVYRRSDDVWRESRFEGLAQDLRHGRRLTVTAPPVMPHAAFMRENCLACHGGPAAREEIRTSHPERARCRQCHVERQTSAVFASAALPRSGK